MSRSNLDQSVTCLGWTEETRLCVGGQKGAVALVSLSKSGSRQILDLQSPIVQIENIEERHYEQMSVKKILGKNILIVDQKKAIILFIIALGRWFGGQLSS